MNVLGKPILTSIFLEDLASLEAMEKLAHAVPWTRQNFIDALASGYLAFCCRIDSHIVGFVFAMVVIDEVHILNITVSPDYFRRGIGSMMLDYLHRVVKGMKVKSSFLEVNENNGKAQLFYKAHGYEQISRRKGYYLTYSGIREDALILSRLLV